MLQQVFTLAMRHFFSPDLVLCREPLASSASWVGNLVAIIRDETAKVIEFSVFVSFDVCVHHCPSKLNTPPKFNSSPLKK